MPGRNHDTDMLPLKVELNPYGTRKFFWIACLFKMKKLWPKKKRFNLFVRRKSKSGRKGQVSQRLNCWGAIALAECRVHWGPLDPSNLSFLMWKRGQTVKFLWMIPQKQTNVVIIIHSSKPIECTAPRASELWCKRRTWGDDGVPVWVPQWHRWATPVGVVEHGGGGPCLRELWTSCSILLWA